MYTAVIVDDELKICQLIRCLGDWEKLGIEIIDICQDGETAVESILRNRPDIVLTDIRMPVYDGLEIISQVRERELDTSFIVISGYRQFEYARQALKYGVVDFLVKPIDQDDLNAALRKAVEEIIDQDNVKRVNSLLCDKEKRDKESLLQKAVEEEDAFWPEEVRKAESLFAGDVFQAVFLKTNRKELNRKESKLFESAGRYLEECMPEEMEKIIVSKADGLYLLMNYAGERGQEIRRALYEVLKRVERENEIYGQFGVSVGVGAAVDEIGKMKSSIRTAKEAWQQRITSDRKDLIVYGEKTAGSTEKQQLFSETEWREFRSLLENCSLQGTAGMIDQLEITVQSSRQISAASLLEAVRQVVFMVETALAEEAHTDKSRDVEEVMEEFRCCDTISDLFLHLKLFVNNSIQTYQEKKQSMKMFPIRKAEEYLAGNYMKDVSLEEMAQIVELSPAYFSRLFKQVEGINYIDYLTQIRINNAKNMLKNTTVSVKTIAAEVGYGNEKYFRKLFKKEVGIRPSEYRKLH